MNAKKTFHDWNADYYHEIHTQNGGKALSCLKCGKCEDTCPKQLLIRKLLEDVSAEFETK